MRYPQTPFSLSCVGGSAGNQSGAKHCSSTSAVVEWISAVVFVIVNDGDEILALLSTPEIGYPLR